MEQYLNFKIIVLGPQGVGKSSLITRYINREFSEQYHVTVGVQYSSKIVQVENQTHVRLQIWDTAGQELFKAVVRTFYKGISAVFLVYAINSFNSFQQLRNWVQEVKENAHQEVVIFLLASKSDLKEQRQVTPEQAASFLREIGGAFFIETSSKSGHQIDTLFQKAADILHKKYMTHSGFKNLVKPVMASGMSDSMLRLEVEGKKKSETRKVKKCCA